MNTNIDNIRQAIMPVLLKYGISSASLVGSVAREDSIMPDGFKLLIDDYAALLSTPGSDINARSAINTEMEMDAEHIWFGRQVK